MPKELLTDNMSAIVTVKGKKKTVHTTFNQFVKDIGSKLVLCKCRHAFTKGKVETSNKYQEWIKPYDFKCDSKSSLFNVIQEILNQSNFQPNSTTKLSPEFLFNAKEKGTLLPLPQITLLISYMQNLEEKTVNTSSLVYFRGAWYGVPYKYINKKILIKEENKLIYIYSKTLSFLATYTAESSGIFYASTLYNIAKKANETEEEFKKRIDQNLKRLGEIGK